MFSRLTTTFPHGFWRPNEDEGFHHPPPSSFRRGSPFTCLMPMRDEDLFRWFRLNVPHGPLSFFPSPWPPLQKEATLLSRQFLPLCPIMATLPNSPHEFVPWGCQKVQELRFLFLESDSPFGKQWYWEVRNSGCTFSPHPFALLKLILEVHKRSLWVIALSWTFSLFCDAYGCIWFYSPLVFFPKFFSHSYIPLS